MRSISTWYVCGALALGLLLIIASGTRAIGLALPWAVLIGLGIPALALLFEHRSKLHEILGAGAGRTQGHH